MANKVTVKIGPLKDEATVKVACQRCGNPTVHSVLTSVERHVSTDTRDGIEFHTSYQVIQCRGCEDISFRKEDTDSESYYQIAEDEWEHDITEALYPPRTSGRVATTKAEELPSAVRSIHEETLQALNGGQPILCGVGIRAIIDAVCIDQKAKGSNLQEQISDLGKRRMLTENGERFLHALRILGNKAAHEIKPHSASDLDVAFSVIEHLLNEVYVMPSVAKGVLAAQKKPAPPSL